MQVLRYGRDNALIFARQTLNQQKDLRETVARILATVRNLGDDAVRNYSKQFDRVDLSNFEVSEEEWQLGLSQTPATLRKLMEEAAENIRDFHRHQLRKGFTLQRVDGTMVGQMILPMERVGLYVPGGTASYPSSVLMNAIPASLAGCREIIMTTPPTPSGDVSPALLSAASIAGVNRFFKIGGAQAIAALAFGTESVPKVDKIVGPGNWYVTEAKRQVFGEVAIDMIAGPSEIVIVADEDAKADWLAADLLSQAEHDPAAMSVLITTSPNIAETVLQQLKAQLATLPRQKIASRSLENHGKMILTTTLEQAVEVANLLAPEHLELCVNDPWPLLSLVKHAGSVFLGYCTPEAVGDYWAGTNHTLPTTGSARFSSPLSVDDFVKKTQFVYYGAEQLNQVAMKIEDFAHYEGLQAHANSVRIRRQGGLQ